MKEIIGRKIGAEKMAVGERAKIVEKSEKPNKPEKKRYYRKNIDFFKLVEKIKLWPSRNGTLHGIKSLKIIGNRAEIITHCNKRFIIHNSKNSRAARWLRNKWFYDVCGQCKIPSWKLEKYSSTFLNKRWGSNL